MDIKELQQQRNKMFKDYYHNIIPERMPVQMMFNANMLAAAAGMDLIAMQFDYSKVAAAAENIENFVYTDTCPVGVASIAARIPGAYQIIDSKTFQMAGNGQMQHPEVVGMLDSDYADLIADPVACLIEKVLPRQHVALSLDNPGERAIRISMIKAENMRQVGKSGAVVREMVAKHGYYSGAPMGSGGFTAAPFDFLGDQLRSFSGICMDVRRHRSEVKEACEKLLPLMFLHGMPAHPDPEGRVGMPLHMPTYLRQKDFEELWLPTYLKLVRNFAARGVRTRPFLEENWMKYIDIIQDFPAGTIMAFEQGDLNLIEEKLGKKFLTTGTFPLMLVKTGTKEQCIDKVKEYIEIAKSNPGYTFGFDKAPLMLSDINVENYLAISEYLRDNCTYANAGESFGTPLNSENFTADPDIGKFESKYIVKWDDYKAKYPHTPDFVAQELTADANAEVKFYISLLL